MLCLSLLKRVVMIYTDDFFFEHGDTHIHVQDKHYWYMILTIKVQGNLQRYLLISTVVFETCHLTDLLHTKSYRKEADNSRIVWSKWISLRQRSDNPFDLWWPDRGPLSQTNFDWPDFCLTSVCWVTRDRSQTGSLIARLVYLWLCLHLRHCLKNYF